MEDGTGTYTDDIFVVEVRLLLLEGSSSGLLVTEEGAHWFFGGVLVFLDTLLLLLGLHNGLRLGGLILIYSQTQG